MLVLDTNVLIYAVHTQGVHHAATTRWLERTLAGPEVIGIPWVAMLGFLRIATNARAFTHPLPVEDALAAARAWFSHPGVTALAPTPRHLDVLSGLVLQSGTAGNLTTDAHIAALALEHGAGVATFDRDFARFGVEVIIPS